MGNQESAGCEPENSGSTSLRDGEIFASNTGICVEPSHPGIKLHLGSGKIKWDGWVNIDLYSDVSDVKSDLRKLDFPDDYADVAVAIHVIEHFYEWEVNGVLEEWRRVLKPGGKVVLELPCMEKILNYIRSCMNEGMQLSPTFSWFALWGDPRNKSVPMCHKWGYTKHMIKGKLLEAGFKDVEFEKPNYHFKSRDMRVVGYK